MDGHEGLRQSAGVKVGECIDAGDSTAVTLEPLEMIVDDMRKVKCCGCTLAEFGEQRVMQRPARPARILAKLPQPDLDPGSVDVGLSVDVEWREQVSAPSQLEMVGEAKSDQDSQATESEVLGCLGCCPGKYPQEISTFFESPSYTWCCFCEWCGLGCEKEQGSMYLQCQSYCFSLECQPVAATGTDVDDDGFEDGRCGLVHSCMWCTHMMQYPPRGGTPALMCCNYQVIDGPTTEPGQVTGQEASKEPAVNFWDFLLFESHVCFYTWCCGCTGHNHFIDCWSTYCKCLGCLCRSTCALPLEFFDEGFGEASGCHHFGSCWLWRCVVEYPAVEPKEGNPRIACCCLRLHGLQIGDDEDEDVIGVKEAEHHEDH